MQKILPLIITCLALPVPAQAIPAITCHCFTDRSYNPARPAAADAYFLAASQNSFFALVYNVDRKSIVVRKQQGVSGDDLWIAYRLALRSGISPESLLEAKQTRGGWPEVAANLRLDTNGTRLNNALKAQAAAPRLAEAAVDELFLQYQLIGEAELASLRQAGATNQELIMSKLLAARISRPARQLLGEVRNGSRSWGALLHEARIDTRDMQRELAATFKLPR